MSVINACQTFIPGPAGMHKFGIVREDLEELCSAGEIPAPRQSLVYSDCMLCGGNGLLPFRPWLHSNADVEGYAIPAGRKVMVRVRHETTPTAHLLPIPFSALLVPFRHDGGAHRVASFKLGLSPNWTDTAEALLELLPDLQPGDAFSMYQDKTGMWGRANGNGHSARLPHGYMHITYGRDQLAELSATMSPDWLEDALRAHPITTNGYGLNTVIHQSRVAAGSLPDDQTLWDIWEPLAGQHNDIAQYHQAVLNLASA